MGGRARGADSHWKLEISKIMPKERTAVLYRCEQVRALDQCAIEEHGIPGFTLMKRAGRACLREIRNRWPGCRRLIVLCGSGNNAGDGYIIAGAAHTQSLRVQLLQLGDPARLSPTATQAREWAIRRGVQPKAALPERLDPARDVIVDALLGIGVQGPPRPDYAEWIAWINAAGVPVCAVDVPSGLCGDTGSTPGATVEADLTVTFIGRKRGLFTGRGPACAGAVRFADLDVPAAVYATQPGNVRVIRRNAGNRWLRPRSRDAHKGHFGHVLVIGGDHGMGGAAALAAEAALRTGSGLVSVATRAANAPALLARRPECMVHSVNSGQDLQSVMGRCTVLVLGPGLGQGAWATQMLQQAYAAESPLVVDADALNLLARHPERLPFPMPAIITPHPGEAARLLGCSVADVQADRFAAAEALVALTGAVTILKGSGSLVCGLRAGDPAPRTYLCPDGNPGMASGGMGDTLSGLLGGLLAQGVPTFQAARLAVRLHAQAGDRAAAARGERGMLASDLFLPLAELLNP